MTDETVYGAFRTADHEAIVASVERVCSKCNAPVWIDQNMLEFAEQQRIICMQCLSVELEHEDDAQLLIHPLQATAIFGFRRRN